MILSRGLVAASLFAYSTVVFAQAVDESALDALDSTAPPLPTVREPTGAVELRAAMRRIAAQPSDAGALADAGNAALALGDANAALNFFTRANFIRPRNGRITAGLAAATVRTENPFEALRLFDDAVKLGISERTIAVDRALAFDLLGNFARAQQDYRLARSGSTSADLIIRQAISMSLAGQKTDADAMLVPLLQTNNGAAWRARAFMLAARGDTRESVKVVQGFMDAQSAQKMERYLRLMPELTAAQQAAAIHLGHFPANNIGRDSENVRRVAATMPASEVGKNESRLIPTGEPLGKKSSREKPAKEKPDRRRDREAKRQAENSRQPGSPSPVKIAQTDKTRLATDGARAVVERAKVATIAVAKISELPPPEAARPLVYVITPNRGLPSPVINGGSLTRTEVQPAPVIIPAPIFAPKPLTNVVEASAISSPSAMSGPRLDGAPVGQSATVFVPNGQPVSGVDNAIEPAAAPIAAIPFDLGAVIGSIEIPESEQKPSVVAVDLKKLKVQPPKLPTTDVSKSAKIDPKAVAKAAATANPSRFWVQIATGAENALGYDYRKWTKKSASLFKGISGWTSAWGKTDRLLVGPFADLKTSKKWEADFNKAGGNGFAWKSENGVVVSALKAK